MSYELDIQRGKQVQEVLENPIYKEAFEAIETEIIRQWREARLVEDREQLHQLLLAHTKAKAVLESVMRSGEAALIELGRKKSRAEQIGNVYHTRWAS